MITENTVQSDEVTIQAPAALVWDILLDFENYSDWNGFCPDIKNESLEMGSAVEMMVNMGGELSRQVEYICRIEPGHCIAWAMDNKPEDPVHAVRSQYVKKVSETSCTYVTIDEFAGPEMAGMMKHFAPLVEQGFNRCAYDLKEHAEKVFGNADN